MRKAIMALAMAGLAACGGGEEEEAEGEQLAAVVGEHGVVNASGTRVRFVSGGVRFRARIRTDRDDRRDFSVTVRPALVNMEAALAAGRYQATRYCLLAYGGSDLAWTQGPDAPREELVDESGELALIGRCTQK